MQPQLAQLIDCIVVNVVCHVSAKCSTPPTAERKQGVNLLPKERGVGDEGEKEVQRDRTALHVVVVVRECGGSGEREERAEFNFGGSLGRSR